MSHLSITAILHHQSLEVEIPPGANLVVGKNSAGKTSLAMTLAALTSHKPNPLRLSAVGVKAYVHDGRSEGSASMDGVTWRPSVGIETDGTTEPAACPHAVGLVNFLATKKGPKERAELWEDLFLPSDPAEILKGAKLDEQVLLTVAEVVTEQGWDKACYLYEAKRSEAKKKWSEVTGAGTWGSKKGATWTPQGWSEDLAASSEENLRGDLTTCEEAVRQYALEEGISQGRIDDARRVRDEEIPPLEQEIDALGIQIEGRQKTLKNLREQIGGIRNRKTDLAERVAEMTLILNAQPQYKCPTCAAGLMMQAGKLVEWTAPDEESRRAAEEGIKEASDKIDAMTAEEDKLKATGQEEADGLSQIKLQRDQMTGQLRALRDAAADADAKPVDPKRSEQETARLERNRQEAQLRLRSFVTYQRAQREHSAIVEYDNIAQLLGPTGLRQEHLQRSLDQVRTILENITKITGWSPIKLGSDYAITVGERPVSLCAENERRKAQWAMQISCMMLTGSTWCILDAADLLRDESWDGLVALVEKLTANPKRADLKMVVCATSVPEIDGWNVIRLD